MKPEFDVVIIGSGPAGVSAAFPLVERGLRVLMVDGGAKSTKPYLKDAYINLRSTDTEQWRWMVGEDFHALKMQDAVSPKLRVPSLAYVFNDYNNKVNIKSNNFIAIGSLAQGGLSNAWGAGVCQFSEKELKAFPFDTKDIISSYKTVTQRIGVSGKSLDDLSMYCGVDEYASPPIKMDKPHETLFNGYQKRSSYMVSKGFRLGRARIAVLTEALNERAACSLTGNCLWGCNNRSIYSATEDLILLNKHENFKYVSGFFVDHLERDNEAWRVFGVDIDSSVHKYFTASKVLLAAGTLASTKLAISAVGLTSSVNILASPTAAFLLWIPKVFGQTVKPGFGLGQLAYSLNVNDDISAYGATFSTSGIPIAEFARHLPFKRFNSLDILSVLLSSCVVGNVFLPGDLTHAKADLSSTGQLNITANYSDIVPSLMKTTFLKLRKYLFLSGGVILPGSFTMGRPGGDIHYAGTFPMKISPNLGESNWSGELTGAKNLYVVDGAALPILPEKPHTLTIMANADRIGRIISATINP